MTKEQYIAKSTELARQQQELKKEYIASNSPIKSGTKVKVTTGNWLRNGTITEYGILAGYICDYDEVKPVIMKLKKDGTPSKFRLFVRYKSIVEVCNE